MDVLRKAPDSWTTSYGGRLYRAMLNPDRRFVEVSSPRNDYRYNRRETFAVLYVSDERETTLYETRQRVYTGAGMAGVSFPGARIALYEARLRRLLNLLDPNVVEALRTNHQELTGLWLDLSDSENGAPTQSLGENAYKAGRFSGIIAPSTYPRRRTVVVMRERLTSDEHVAFIGFEEP